jgi:protein involved in polysaccharide export with SLBB domain
MSFGTKLTSSMIALMLLAGFGAGCAKKAPPPSPNVNVAALAPPAPPRATDEYRIQAGDELHVRFTYQPEMNEQIPVRPDGRISLATTGEIVATGLTPTSSSGWSRGSPSTA